VTLDGVVPPALVLLAAAILLGGRRLLWKPGAQGAAASPLWTDAAIALLIVGLGAALLVAMGRPLTYQHGPVRVWSGSVQSDQNSQQLFDPYALTHVTHGVLLYWLTGLVGRIRAGTRVVLALALETAWEVFENTDMVIQRYRATTVSLGYYGDSVLNTVGDVLAAAAGCLLAVALPVWLLVLGVLLLEGILAVWIRDNLTLNLLMLLRPIEAIRRWQLGG
jgi:hypothetical protein